MKSTPETIMEAQRALARYMESERQRQCHRSTQIGSPTSFSTEDDAQHGPEPLTQMETSPTQRAAEYAKARNQNLRPLRQIDEADENARDGRDSALAYLERRRRSVLRR